MGLVVLCRRVAGAAVVGRSLVDVLIVLPSVERSRMKDGPATAIARAREAGLSRGFGSSRQRRQTKRVVAWLDRRLFAQPNCYRRVLLEIALNRQAAGERVMLGFRGAGGTGSGHAWLESDVPPEPYEAILSI